MKMRNVDPKKVGNLLFELDNRAFNRKFDLPARNVQEEIDYLTGSHVYVLFDRDTPIGFFAIKKENEGFEVKTVVVVPEMQGKGYGQMMMRELLTQTEGKPVFLVTHPDNAGALRFYQKQGFVIYGRKENYYGDGEPRLLLKRVP